MYRSEPVPLDDLDAIGLSRLDQAPASRAGRRLRRDHALGSARPGAEVHAIQGSPATRRGRARPHRRPRNLSLYSAKLLRPGRAKTTSFDLARLIGALEYSHL